MAKKKEKFKTNRQSYDFYVNNSEQETVDKKTYIDLSEAFSAFLAQKVIDGEIVKLPHRMGLIYVKGKRQLFRFKKNGEPYGLAPNWAKTKELWQKDPKAKEAKKIVYCDNAGTNFMRYRFFWSKDKVWAENKAYYTLIMSKTNKTIVRKKIQAGKEYLTNEQTYR